MKIFRWLMVAVVWLGSGYFNRGYTLYNFTAEFPSQRQEPFVSTFSYMTGPASVIGVLVSGGYIHFMSHEYTCQQRWEAFENEGYTNLGKDYFVHRGGNIDCTALELQ